MSKKPRRASAARAQGQADIVLAVILRNGPSATSQAAYQAHSADAANLDRAAQPAKKRR